MKPSLKINSLDRAIPQHIASPYSFDGFARAAARRFGFVRAVLLVTAVLCPGTTATFARTPAFDENRAEARASAASANQATGPAGQPSTTTTTAAGENPAAGAAPLRVMVGKSLLINTTERLKRVSVTDPSVADALVVT